MEGTVVDHGETRGNVWCSNISKRVTTGYFKGDLGTVSNCFCGNKRQIFFTESQAVCSRVCGHRNLIFWTGSHGVVNSNWVFLNKTLGHFPAVFVATKTGI